MHDSYYTGEPLRIGNELNLLATDALIEDRWNVTRVLTLPEKYLRNPVLLGDRPWEDSFLQGPCVLYDGGRFRMWYEFRAGPEARRQGATGLAVGYAESDNGYDWVKPLLNTCPYPGFDRTNVVYFGGHRRGVQSNKVFIDAAESDPSRRYKMVTLESRPSGDAYTSGVNLATSPDGLTWKLDGDRHICDFHSDCYNHLLHDPYRQRWILYGRPMYWFTVSGQRNRIRRADDTYANRHTRRRVYASVSTDLKNWSYPRTVMYPDERDFSDYDDSHAFRVGPTFAMLYSAMDEKQLYANELRLAVSGDGLHWERFHTREAFIPRGRAGDWDAGMTFHASAPVNHGDRALIYYTGAAKPQSLSPMIGAIGVTVSRPGRFVALHADEEPGYVVTREFKLEGNRLRVNVRYHSRPYSAHYLRAEFVQRPATPGDHADFNPALEGFTLDDCDPVRWVDDHQALVKWKGNADLSRLDGRNVYLRFELRNMDVFGFQITNE